MLMDIKQFIQDIVSQLTGAPAHVTIEEDESGAIITVAVSGNVPSLIGKNGTTIDALRTILKALGYNGKHRIKLRIDEKT